MENEFDKIASEYEAWHEDAVGVSGFNRDYFYERKVNDIQYILNKQKISHPSTILDFGCGIGDLDPYLRGRFPDSSIYGVDVSEESIQIAKEKQKAHNIEYSIYDTDWKSSAQQRQFDTGFDLVVASVVFHHITEQEKPSALEYINAHMKLGGYLFVFEHNPYNPVTRLIFNKADRPVDKNAELIRSVTLKRLLTKCGFQVLLCDYSIFFPKFLGAFIRLERYMKRIPIGGQYCILAKKL